MPNQAPQRAMVIVAHPDDPEYFSGGTIANWCAAGSNVCYLILTNGNKGSDDPSMTPAALTELRQREQRAAADILGVGDIIYLQESDGELMPTLELRTRVVAEIRRFQPDAVISTDPSCFFVEDRYINHADHRAAGQIAIDAVFPAARNRMYHPELLEQGLEPHRVKEMYLTIPEKPNLWVDITARIEQKAEAILAHASQTSDPQRTIERMRMRARLVDPFGQEKFGEPYRVMRIG